MLAHGHTSREHRHRTQARLHGVVHDATPTYIWNLFARSKLHRDCRQTRRQVGRTPPLANFAKVISIYFFGSFNMIRLATEAKCKNTHECTSERGVLISNTSVVAYDDQYRCRAAYLASDADIVDMTLPDCPRPGTRPSTPGWRNRS